MNEQLYVATNTDGVEETVAGDVAWALPRMEGGVIAPGAATRAPAGGELVLRRPAALLEELGERIFVAEPVEGTDGGTETVGARAARLTAETAWGVEGAARFALDCAAHALGAAATTTLPDGSTLADVIAEARLALDRTSPAGEEHLGLLARLAAVRRLRRLGAEVGDASLAVMSGDVGSDLDALDDPAWTTIAACSEAVLAALEALRHLAMPRYVRAREDSLDEHGADEPSTPGALIPTPWGPIALGAEHHSAYAPSWAAARDAAARARESAADESAQTAEAERAYQAQLLEQILRGRG